MPKYRYVVRLKDIHDKTGLSPYMVSKKTGITVNTVDKYVSNEVETEYVYWAVAALCDFYGVNLWDVVEVKKSPEMRTPLAAALTM